MCQVEFHNNLNLFRFYQSIMFDKSVRRRAGEFSILYKSLYDSFVVTDSPYSMSR